MIKAVLWDLDGTILDFKIAQYNAIKECFKHFNLGTCSDEMIEVYSKINAHYWEILERGEMTKGEILLKRFEDFFNLYGVDTSVIPQFEDEYQIRLGDTICYFPHALEVLDSLHGKVIQCMVTNGTKVTQDRKLMLSGLGKYFDHIFISEVVGAEKPSIEFFNKVFETIGEYTKDEVLIIGDSLTSDIKGGNNAGIKTCWFNPASKENTKSVKIDFEISDLNELLTIIGA